MTLFHQNSPQLQNQLKAFPVRLNDVKSNVSQADSDYFADYDEALDGKFLEVLRILTQFFRNLDCRVSTNHCDRNLICRPDLLFQIQKFTFKSWPT
jgi:hypothetical protein